MNVERIGAMVQMVTELVTAEVESIQRRTLLQLNELVAGTSRELHQVVAWNGIVLDVAQVLIASGRQVSIIPDHDAAGKNVLFNYTFKIQLGGNLVQLALGGDDGCLYGRKENDSHVSHLMVRVGDGPQLGRVDRGYLVNPQFKDRVTESVLRFLVVGKVI